MIVPAYNEAHRLGNTLSQLRLYSDDIVVAVDGCTDGTEKVARKLGITVVFSKTRLGKGGAIIEAARYAKNDRVIVVDADLPIELEALDRFAEALDNADLIYGSRALWNSKILIQPPWHRKVLGKGFNWLLRKMFKVSVHDSQCGFKAFHKSSVLPILERLNVNGWAFDVELLLKAYAKGLTVWELPVQWSYKSGSKLRVFRQVWEMGSSLLMLWFQNQKRESSIPDFYDSLNGDTYHRAANSWFLPRRYWHSHKNNQIIKNINGTTILDVGCGSGELLQRLKDKDVYGVDVGKEFIRYCLSHCGYAKVSKQNAEHLDFSSCSFEDVICSEVIEHLESPMKALREFHRVLKPNGRLILTTPRACLRWSLLEYVWSRVRREKLEVNHESFSMYRLGRLLRQAGFNVKSLKPFMGGCLLFAVVTKS